MFSVMKMLKTVSAYAVELKSKANGPKVARMKFRSAAAIEITSPDEPMTALKRYLRESNDSEIVVGHTFTDEGKCLLKFRRNSFSADRNQ